MKKNWKKLKEKEKILKEAAKVIDVQPRELPKAIKKFKKEIKQMETRKKKLEKINIDEIKKKTKSLNGLEYLVEKIPGATMPDLIEISNKLQKENRVLILVGVTRNGVRLLGSAGKSVVNSGLNLTKFMKGSVGIIDGEVGGNKYQSKGGGPRIQNVDKFIRACRNRLKKRFI